MYCILVLWVNYVFVLSSSSQVVIEEQKVKPDLSTTTTSDPLDQYLLGGTLARECNSIYHKGVAFNLIGKKLDRFDFA